jgi:hypothetical protein
MRYKIFKQNETSQKLIAEVSKSRSLQTRDAAMLCYLMTEIKKTSVEMMDESIIEYTLKFLLDRKLVSLKAVEAEDEEKPMLKIIGSGLRRC